MTPERWIRLKELFEGALEVPPSERAAYAAQVCEGDEEMRSEMEKLVAADQEAGRFLGAATKTAGVRAELPFGGQGDAASPEEPAPTFANGCLLAGRFRISSFLGRGGMGEVYEAWDEDLRQSVALKTLRPEISRDPRAGERLRNEIQNGRRVTHHNVCRIFDRGRHQAPGGDILFFTMELVAGETLAARLKNGGPLPPQEALDVARQMAEALDAAHREGIIHRDFKTGNVMLAPTQGGIRVVVTDFGLARTLERTHDESLTAPGMIVGTPAYMAPEQLAGEEATVASDIYSFGVVLCEMATGKRPPTGCKLLEAAARFNGWHQAVMRCLETDAARRFSSALQAIRAIEERNASQVTTVAYSPRSYKPLFLLVAAIIFLLVAGFFAFSRLYSQRPLAKEGSQVMLADVTNSTGDHDLDAATELFRSQLGQSAYVTLWDRNRLPAALRTMLRSADSKLDGNLAREIALRENVPFVVFGNIAPLGDQFVVNVRLEYLESGTIFSRSRWTHSVQAAGKSELSGAIHDSCNWLRRTIGESEPDMAARDRLPDGVTSSSWEALRAYGRAESFQAEGQSEVAVQVLKEAVLIDPHFALAYMRLGDILMSLRQQEEGLTYWRKAEEEANRVHLTRREELRLRGLYAGDTWDWSEYEAAFAQMEREYPHEYLASFYLADALCQQGNFQACVSKLTDAGRKRPGSIPVADNLGLAYLLLGNATEAERQARELERLGRPDLAARLRGAERFSVADFGGALEFYKKQTASAEPHSRSSGYWLQAATFAEMGKLQEAETTLRHGIDEDSKFGLIDQRAGKLISIGYLRLSQGDTIGARREALSGAAETGSPGLLLQAATILARAGEPSESTKVLGRIKKIAAETKMAAIASGLVQGEIMLQQGKAKGAVDAFGSCARIDSVLRPKTGLARALFVASSPQEALDVFEHATETLGRIYLGPERIFPGEFTDMLFDQANCAIAAHRLDEARLALTEYLKRRASAGREFAEVRKARQLLDQINSDR